LRLSALSLIAISHTPASFHRRLDRSTARRDDIRAAPPRENVVQNAERM
jgi:hypothetical protein